MSTDVKRHTQEQRILWLLESSRGWVPAVALSQISLQFCARIFSARKRGWIITNKIERQRDGTKRSFYRLGPAPTPSSKQLRASQQRIANQPGELFDMHRNPD